MGDFLSVILLYRIVASLSSIWLTTEYNRLHTSEQQINEVLQRNILNASIEKSPYEFAIRYLLYSQADHGFKLCSHI